jgi:hypothetical protein
MQPPFIFETLKDSIERLKSEALCKHGKSEKDANFNSIPNEYTERIQSWISNLPPVQLRRKFTIAEVIALAALSGHFRPKASHRYAGEALRRCGFVQKRDWTNSGRNKRYWVKGV